MRNLLWAVLVLSIGNATTRGDEGQHSDKNQQMVREPAATKNEQQVRSKRPSIQLMRAREIERYKALLPVIEDAQLQSVLNDPATMWYDHKTMPPAYQDSIPPFVGILETRRSGDVAPPELFSRGQFRFPFGTTGGTHRVTTMKKVNFLALPRDDQQQLPIVWWKEGYAYAWMFPIGTIIGEVLMQETPDDQLVVFEVRIRRRQADYWHADAFRPFPTADNLSEAVKQARPHWERSEELMTLIAHLNDASVVEPRTLNDRYGAFRTRGGVDVLPPIDPILVKELLTTNAFKSSEGSIWKSLDKVQCHAPTATAFSIVPKDYDAGLIAVDNASCRRCHEHAGQRLGRFVFEQQLYGQVWGSDETFSWHPFEPSKLLSSPNGIAADPLRKEFANHRVITAFDSERHKLPNYQRLRSPKS